MGPTVLRPVRVLSGNAHPTLAGQVAREPGLPPTPTEAGTFADGEARVRIAGDVGGAAVVVVQPTGPPAEPAHHLSGLEFRALEEESHEPDGTDALPRPRGRRPAARGELEGA